MVVTNIERMHLAYSKAHISHQQEHRQVPGLVLTAYMCKEMPKILLLQIDRLPIFLGSRLLDA
ncbi:hypothetical protein D3C72_2304890 [compost metagenome]